MNLYNKAKLISAIKYFTKEYAEKVGKPITQEILVNNIKMFIEVASLQNSDGKVYPVFYDNECNQNNVRKCIKETEGIESGDSKNLSMYELNCMDVIVDSNVCGGGEE